MMFRTSNVSAIQFRETVIKQASREMLLLLGKAGQPAGHKQTAAAAAARSVCCLRAATDQRLVVALCERKQLSTVRARAFRG